MSKQDQTRYDQDDPNVGHQFIGDNAEDTAKVPIVAYVLPEDWAGRDCRDHTALDGAVVPSCGQRLLNDVPLTVIVRREVSDPGKGGWVDQCDDVTEQDKRVREKIIVLLSCIGVKVHASDPFSLVVWRQGSHGDHAGCDS